MTTLDTEPGGLRISVDGGPLRAAPFSLALSPGRHTISTAETYAGSEGTRYVFNRWSDGGAATHEITTGSVAARYTAEFAIHYLLRVSAMPAGGGSIKVAPPSSVPPGWYDAGAQVTPTAIPLSGFQFASFEGALLRTINPQTITISGPSVVVAKFSAR